MKQDRKLDAQDFFFKLFRRLRGRLSVRRPPLLKPWDEYNINDDLIRDLVKALTTELPPLERVLMFSMHVNMESLKQLGFISNEELDDIKLRDKIYEDELWPAHEAIIEQWNTHTVIIPSAEYSGYSSRRKTFYEHAPWVQGEVIIWWYEFPSHSATLQVVLHANAIQFAVIRGTVLGQQSFSTARDKYVLIRIPLDDEELNNYRSPILDKYSSPTNIWTKTYFHQDPTKGISWKLDIQDTLAPAIDESMES